MAKKLPLAVGGVSHDLLIRDEAEGLLQVEVEGTLYEVGLTPLDGAAGLFQLMIDGRRSEVVVERRGRELLVVVGPDRHTVSLQRPGRRDAGYGALPEGEFVVAAPMTGTVVEVLVAGGDRVERGDALVVVAAMKMNNEVRAPASAVVRRVHVAVDDAVEQGAALVTLEAARPAS